MRSITATGAAKLILFGEHSVVYGQPAIAIPLSDLRASVSITPSNELNIQMPDINRKLSYKNDFNHPFYMLIRKIASYYGYLVPSVDMVINSEIPVASGLGSGAAISTAIVRALAHYWTLDIDLETINNFVFEIENVFHGTPSGLDNTVIVYEEPMYYVKGKPIRSLINRSTFTLLVADTGVKSETHNAVNDVRKLYETDKHYIGSIFESIGKVVEQAGHIMHHGNWEELGQLMIQNHRLLKELTVSSEELESLVDVALAEGALGAKLSGSGRGGNMIALVDDDSVSSTKNALIVAGATRVLMTEVRATV